VKDPSKSIKFYEDLGFVKFAGNADHGYTVMKNEETLVGLYQDMSERNVLMFNLGWEQSAAKFDPYENVRDIKAKIKSLVMI